MAIKYYTKEYAGVLPKIYAKRALFLRTFGGSLQVTDGVKENDTFMELKTSDTEVVLQDYNTGENVAFGTGTGSSNRFGPRNEIKSVNTQVNYEAPLAIHEGIDNFTVNDIPEQVLAERYAEQAEAWVEYINGLLGAALSAAASDTLTGDLTEAGVVAVFNEARTTFVNNHVQKQLSRTAYVTSTVYNLLVDAKLTTPAKQSNANVATGELQMFKGFVLEELADDYFEENEHIIFAVDNVGVAGVGIEVARTLDSEDFYGVAIQGAGKYAKHIPAKNNKAILKASLAAVPAG